MKIENIEFKMPRYNEIPNVGLYLEQTVKYINQCIEPLHLSITTSMLSNYVKKGYVSRPIQKQYYADQIAYLIFISIVKQTLSMQDILSLFDLQKQTHSAEEAYNYFVTELEHGLENLIENKNTIINTDNMPYEKRALTNLTVVISHIIYLNFFFEAMKREKEIEKEEKTEQ